MGSRCEARRRIDRALTDLARLRGPRLGGTSERSDLLTSFTALPNLHPLLVHFPIALLPIALLFDLASLRPRLDWLGRPAMLLYSAAMLGAAAAYWAGRQAVDSLPPMAPQVQRSLNEHSDSGLYTLWVVAVLAVLRVALGLWDRQGGRKAPRVVLLLMAAGAVVLLFRTADLGGGLVYRHGVAVAPVEAHRAEVDRESAVPAESGATAERLIIGADGALSWRPRGGDRQALGWILRPASGSDLSAVSWLDPEGDGRGIRLSVQGEAMLVLPGIFGDVQAEAELVLEDFEGEIGVAHHVRSAGEAGFFKVDVSSGVFVLGSLDVGVRRELDRRVDDLPDGTIRMTVSAIGQHLKGLLGDESIVHGHEPAPPDGACGILLRGDGVVRILSMRITPVV